MTSRFDTYTDDLTPEPVDVYVAYERCPEHNFNLINTPRDTGSDEPRRVKCPLRTCNYYGQ